MQVVVLIAGAAAAPLRPWTGPDDKPEAAACKAKIEELIRASGAETVAVALGYGTEGEILINPDVSFHAASTMKVPVMMEVFRQADQGMLSLDATLPVKNDFVSLADGSHYSITSDSDSEQSLYKKIGQPEKIRQLVRLMITESSNLAANILIEKVTAPRVMELMREIGANKIQVLRGVEDEKAYERQLNNTTTARDLMIVLSAIDEGRAVSKPACGEMIGILLGQKFNEGIPAGLPPSGIRRVAHKTGSITGIYHDAAIVYRAVRKPYVLVVLTLGIREEARAQKLVAEISRVIYEYSMNGPLIAAGASNADGGLN